MNRVRLLVIAVAVLAGTGLLAGLPMLGSSGDSADEEPQVVYICRETEELVVAPRQPVPAVHPETGRKTLVRALYCKQCDRWYPAPPAAGLPGNPLNRRCPRHRTPLSPDGPVEGRTTGSANRE